MLLARENHRKNTINRLIQKYDKYGKSGFIHRNRNRLPSKTKEESLKSEIITLYNGKY